MESYEKFYTATFIWNRKMLASLGHDIYDKDFKPNIITLFIYIIFVTFIFFILYTVIYYDNFTRCNCIFYISIAIQAGFKLYNSRYHLEFLKMITFIENLFKLHIKTKSKERRIIFERFAFYTDTIVKCGSIMWIGSQFLSVTFTIFMYVYMHEKIPLALIFVPGIDETTPSGFFILMCIQFVAVIMTAVGMCCCDVFYAIILSNVPIMARLIEDEIKQLNKTLKENPNDVHTWKNQFRNILIMHREMSIYLSELNDIFFKISFVQVATCMLAGTSQLHLVITTSYIPALIISPCLLFTLFIFCTLGHIVEATNDIAEAAVLDINWNIMSMIEQKQFKQLICNVQNPCFLTIGGILPLNWRTCVQLFKNIYYFLNISYSMQ